MELFIIRVRIFSLSQSAVGILLFLYFRCRRCSSVPCKQTTNSPGRPDKPLTSVRSMFNAVINGAMSHRAFNLPVTIPVAAKFLEN